MSYTNSTDEIKAINGATLTAAYAANTSSAYEFRSAQGATFQIVYDRNAGSASAYLEMQVEVSADGTNWAAYGVWTDGGSGVMTYTEHTYKQLADANRLLVLDEVRARFIRVKVQETLVTTTNFGTVSVYIYPHTA